MTLRRTAGRSASDPGEECVQGPGGPWPAPYPRDPPGSTHGRRCLGGGGCHLGAPEGGLQLQPWPLGLGAAGPSSSS
jgi:hypothetical protein